MSESISFKNPATLAEFVQLCNRVINLNMWNDVCVKIDTVLQPYLDGYSATTYVMPLSTKLFMLLVTLGDNYISDYGKYSLLPVDENIDFVVAAMADVLPRILGVCTFLHFMISSTHWSSLDAIGGGNWNRQKFGGSYGWNSDLAKFLNDTTYSSGRAVLLRRGLDTAHLHGQEGSQLTADLLVTKGSISSRIGPIQYVQCGLIFFPSADFQCSNLANAMCFLLQFSVDLSSGMFVTPASYKSSYSIRLQGTCERIPAMIDSLVSNGVTNHLEAVYTNGHKEMYKGKLAHSCSALEKYVAWLRNNMDAVVFVLREMKSDSAIWSNDLKSGHSAGPFKYGFTFGDGWDSSKSPTNISDAVDSLTADDGPLLTLQDLLKNGGNCQSLPQYTGASVGIATATAAAAGASYSLYNNIFGVTDLIRSIFFR